VQQRIRVVTLIDLIGAIGGAERLAGLLAAGLDQDRFESIVVVSRYDADDPDHPAMKVAADELEATGVEVVGLARKSSVDLPPWRRLGALLRGREVDVLHAHKLGSNLWGSAIGTAARTPVIVSHEHSWSFEGQWARKQADRQIVGRLSDAIIAVSREDQRRMVDVVGMDAGKVRFIPNGAPPRVHGGTGDVRVELGIAADAPVVATVGMLRAEKAFDVLLDAVDELRATVPGLQLLIVGYGDEEEALAARIVELGLGGNVRMLGHREDVPAVLAAADVAVLSSDREGMPISVIEYMEAGLPVVSTRVGGLPDMIDDGVHGLLVPPRDPHALAAALGALLGDPDRRDAMGKAAAARRFAEFGMETMTRRVEELYVELLDGR
jgi:glycosyltransferase involved in cell wall biosynthesis